MPICWGCALVDTIPFGLMLLSFAATISLQGRQEWSMRARQACALRYICFLLFLLITAAYSAPLYHLLALPGVSFAVCNSGCAQSFGVNCYLACPRSQSEQNAVSALMATTPWNNARLGGTRNVGNLSIFRWTVGPYATADGGLGLPFFVNDTSVTGACVPGMYCDWKAGEPNNTTNERDVVLLSSGNWNDLATTNTAVDGCICECAVLPSSSLSRSLLAPLLPTSSRSFTMSASSNFEYWSIDVGLDLTMTLLENFKKWDNICSLSRRNGYLAAPLSQTENAFAAAAQGGQCNRSYLGAHHLAPGGSFRWRSGPFGKQNNFSGVTFFDGLNSSLANCTTGMYCNFGALEPRGFGEVRPFLAMTGPLLSSEILGSWSDGLLANCALCQRRFGLSISSPFTTSPSEVSSLSLSHRRTQSAVLTLSSSPSAEASHTCSVAVSKSMRTVTVTGTVTVSGTLSRSLAISHSEGMTPSLEGPVVILLSNDSVSGSILSAGQPPFSGNNTFGNNGQYVSITAILIHSTFSRFVLENSSAAANCFQSVPQFSGEGSTGAEGTVRRFVSHTTIVTLTSRTSAVVLLKADPTTYAGLTTDVVVAVGIAPRCMTRPLARSSPEVSFVFATFVVQASVRDWTQGSLVTVASGVAGIVSVLVPTLAIQASRNTAALTIELCQAEEGILNYASSPTTIAMGNTEVAHYVGGSVMNHVVILSFAVLQFVVVVIVRFCRREEREIAHDAMFETTEWRDAMQGDSSWSLWLGAMTRVRFPSAVVFPVMVLVDSTAACAIVTIMNAEASFRTVGVISMLLCAMYPLFTAVYLSTTFASAFDERITVHPLRKFFFGSGKWRDNVGEKGSRAEGYLRRSRLLFDEYRPGRQYFLVVEMTLGVSIGALEGIKLGYGNCTIILYVVTVLLGLYGIAFSTLMPCKAPFGNIFGVVLAALQFAVSVILCFPYDEARMAAASKISMATSFLILGRSAVAIGELYFTLRHALQRSNERYRESQVRVVSARCKIDALECLDVPDALAACPISMLLKSVANQLNAFPFLAESGLYETLQTDDVVNEVVLHNIQQALAENVRRMKYSARRKQLIDGDWRDWRDEQSLVPPEVVALEKLLRCAFEKTSGTPTAAKSTSAFKTIAPGSAVHVAVTDEDASPPILMMDQHDADDAECSPRAPQQVTLQSLMTPPRALPASTPKGSDPLKDLFFPCDDARSDDVEMEPLPHTELDAVEFRVPRPVDPIVNNVLEEERRMLQLRQRPPLLVVNSEGLMEYRDAPETDAERRTNEYFPETYD